MICIDWMSATGLVASHAAAMIAAIPPARRCARIATATIAIANAAGISSDAALTPPITCMGARSSGRPIA
jgi:hypothetical protein